MRRLLLTMAGIAAAHWAVISVGFADDSPPTPGVGTSTEPTVERPPPVGGNRQSPGSGSSMRIEQIAERIEQVTFESRILNRPKRFCVIRPDPEGPHQEDWSVLFLLHGRGRHERSLIDDSRCRAALLEADCAVVLPDGDDGWYIDSPVKSADRYASYLEEVIAQADAVYPLSRRRTRRGLGGWSMGGYGCVRYAINHSEDFGLVASIIGLLDFPRDGLPPGQRYAVPTERFGSDRMSWRAFNPKLGAAALRETSILLITADEAFDRTMNENFRARLQALAIDHEWRVLRGGHTFDVVRESLPRVLRFAETHFSAADEP